MAPRSDGFDGACMSGCSDLGNMVVPRRDGPNRLDKYLIGDLLDWRHRAIDRWTH
jgi:hypothetical protein